MQHSDFNDLNGSFDKDFRKGAGCFGLWFVFVALLALAVLGGLGWAIVELVNWITTK